MDDLSTNYDVIVVGTGMTESILASALSRIGKSVLHLDSNEYYGENWASFNFDGIQKWIQKMNGSVGGHESPSEESLKDGETINRLTPVNNISNVNEKWYCELNSETVPEDNTKCDKESKDVPGDVDDAGTGVEIKQEPKTEDTKQFIMKESRRFNLDLSPKVLFSQGPLVKLLISSNIAKYAEFKAVSRVLTWRNNHLELVPCSRADVFSTRNISVVEKRLLVKILTEFLNYPDNSEELSGFAKKTFIDYLKHKKLPNNIIHYVLYAMAMGDDKTPCLDGVKASKTFLESLGKYGNTPFIFTMYGAGELPQCFCRLCAVFGGVYYLKRGVEGIITSGKKCVGVVSEKQRLNADHFVFSSRHMSSVFVTKKDTIRISRGIFVTDRSILQSEKEPLTLLLFPPIPNVSDKSVTIIELGPGTSTCPDKTFVVHMTCLATNDADSDLRHVVDALFENADSGKPKLLWSVTWNATEDVSVGSELENVKVCSGPTTELGYNLPISEAMRLFKEICPDEEFLPRAPDPDEIVLPGDENEEDKSVGEGDSTKQKTDDNDECSGEKVTPQCNEDVQTGGS